MNLFKLFKGNEKGSSQIAKDRLQLVLVRDRTDTSPEYLDMIKKEVLALLDDYMEVNDNEMEFKITRVHKDTADGSVPALEISVPITRIKKSMK
mgnify:CR=1 FL=1